MRILISAYGCEPGKGSEQGVGWHWCMELARIADIVVLTRSNNKAAVDAALPSELIDKVHFEFYDLPPSIRRFKRKEKGLYFYYLLWQWGVYRKAKQLAGSAKFDYCMHLTFGSIWLPTFMHRLPLPFIWGPVGGGEAVPLSLITSLPSLGRVSQYLRYVLKASLPLNPMIMSIVRRSKVILARTEDTARLVPKRYANKVKVVLETAMSKELSSTSVTPVWDRGDRILKVVYTGRLVGLKNVSAAIRAVARAIGRGAQLHLLIVGDGPLRPGLEVLASELGIASSVEFRGAVSQAEVIQALQSSDVYLFPSLKEGGSWSLMEAMSVGLPAICVKGSGMALITDDDSAIRIEARSQEQMIDDFSAALLELERSPERRQYLGENARIRIEQKFQWKNKRDFMTALFDELEHAAV